jgi:hypothetical protein
MKQTWVIPAILVVGLAGLGGLTHAASAGDGDGRGPGYMHGERGDDGWSGQRWRDRDDDRRGYGPREGRRSNDDNDCGPRGRGYHGRGHGMHHGYGRGREDMDRGDDQREGRGYNRDRGYDRDRNYGRSEGRGDGWREGRRSDRDDSDRGYRGHGYHHRYQDRQENRQDGRQEGRQDGRQEGRGGPRGFGRGFDPARLESAKKELGVTEAQEQAWTKYASTLKEVADARKARRESMDPSAMRRMSAEEHRKFRDSMIEQRRKEQDSVNAAIDELVKSLDEKQVAIAKEVLPGYSFGPCMRGAGMGAGGDGNR